MAVNSSTSFEGTIASTWKESRPWWPAPARPASGAPNVLIIVLDDVGFSDIGCYGSGIATPRMDALASAGLRYNNFHVTAMCSPTRACLMTGRNAHAVGVGVIAEWAGGFPGYRGKLSRSAATLAETLGLHGYGSYAIGKWHLLNMEEYGSAGPHDGWPLGRGFNRWYGFHGALADQWNPEMFKDNRAVELQKGSHYHLSADLVDHAIGDIRDHLASAPDRPFFQYLALGACHWPHQVPQSFIDSYRGRFSQGWDVERGQRFQRQLELGVVPAGTVLAPRNPGVPAWADLDRETRRTSERLQEAYAGFMEHTDAQIGRLVDFLAGMDQLENTLVMLLSDNGASAEGGVAGAVNARRNLVYEKETPDYTHSRIDEIGGERAFNHYATGWAQVSNTPLKWYKRGNHGGGIRAPLIVHWPRGLRDTGAVRSQYHHVIDIAPTVYELAGAHVPELFQGVPQIPMHGTSMAYSFTDAGAATRKTRQVFEMLGDRAIWHQGWKAVARHAKGQDFAADRWELYWLDADFSECDDLAAKEPEKLAQLVAVWDEEATRHQIYPLDDRETERLLDRPRANPRTLFELTAGMSRMDRHASPDISDRGFLIEARYVNVEGSSTEGVIVSYGSWFGGIVLYVAGGKAHFEYLYSESKRHIVSADVPCAPGPVGISVRFERTGRHAGTAHLAIDGHVAASVAIDRTWTVNVLTAGMHCGYDGTAPVSEAYRPPYTFTGQDLRVRVGLDPRPDGATASDARAFAAALKEQ